MSLALHRRDRQGFTLVELLVVLAVLSLLAAILLPSLAAARARARETDCRARLGQIGLALRMYADDHDGGLPLSSSWSRELIRYLRTAPPYGCPDVKNWTFNPRAPLDPSELMPGYGYNGLLGAPVRLNGFSPSMSMAQVRFPAATVSFCDAHIGSFTLTQPDGLQGRMQEAGGLRHQGGANYAFLDGHVRWHRPEEIDPPGSGGRRDGTKPTFLPTSLPN
jgi:prepilin-type N-terminal cleavage/methylation domain-containing protein/prepilin-type processing-associated H-X9-DG protein